AQEDLHAGAAQGHRGARPATLDRVADGRRPPAQHLAAQLRRLNRSQAAAPARGAWPVAIGRAMDIPRWQSSFGDYLTSSFVDVLRRESPDSLPALFTVSASASGVADVPHGTTVLALRY